MNDLVAWFVCQVGLVESVKGVGLIAVRSAAEVETEADLEETEEDTSPARWTHGNLDYL